MDDSTSSANPHAAERRFAEMLDQAGLPQFTSTYYDRETKTLELTWDHGLTLHLDLERDIEPIDHWDRAAILNQPLPCGCEPIHVTVPGSAADPREEIAIPGVVLHHSPTLHPDDVTTIDGIPATSPSRTLIDLAEILSADELRAAFSRARELGLLDPKALLAARARAEWRPSLAMLDEVIDEFCES